MANFSLCGNDRQTSLLHQQHVPAGINQNDEDKYWVMRWSVSFQNEEWSGGAMVLDKLSVPGHPTILD